MLPVLIIFTGFQNYIPDYGQLGATTNNLPETISDLPIEIISSLIAFFLGYLLAILIENRKNKKNLKNMMNGLVMELKYIYEILPENKTIVKFPKDNEFKFDVFIAIIDIPILDVILNTGGYQEFKLDVQKNLSNLRGTVIQSNHLMNELIHIRYNSSGKLSRFEVENFGQEIERHHKKIRDIIKLLLDQLDKKL